MYKIPEELKKKIFFVIPTYNEEKTIERVIKELHKEGFKNLIIVDDGSKDKTSKNVLENQKEGLILLIHPINRGQGAALKTGIDYCIRQKECKYIVTFDSDGQHRLSDLPKFIEPLEKKQCEMVLGSRFLDKDTKKNIPLKKIILLKGAILVTFFLSRKWFTDTHNGYRVMTKEIAKKIEISMDGFEHASEILDEIVKKQIIYKEVPVYIDYTDYSKKKGQKITNSINILTKMILKK